MADSTGKARRGRRWTGFLAGGIVVLFAGHGAAWYVATGWIKAEIPGFVAAAAASGWVVNVGQNSRTGWPWAATVCLAGVEATRDLGNAKLRWTAERIDVTLTPRDTAALHVSARGRQSIVVGTEAALDGHAALTDIRLPFAATPATFEIHALRVEAARTILAGLITGQVTPSTAAVSAANVTVSPALPAPFDGGLDVSASLSSEPAFPLADPTVTAAAAWREGGGRVTMPAADLRWGPLHATGSGSGGLDAQLQPAGKAVLNVEGGLAALDAASNAGLVSAGPASAARAVLGLLALAAGGGPVQLPISIADGTLSIANFPLARLPAVAWQAP